MGASHNKDDSAAGIYSLLLYEVWQRDGKFFILCTTLHQKATYTNMFDSTVEHRLSRAQLSVK
jgi:hypothetical protein